MPLPAGSFGVDDYIAYVIRFLEEIGPGVHRILEWPLMQEWTAAARAEPEEMFELEVEF